MKKFYTFIILLVYFFTFNISYAGELYKIKNTNSFKATTQISDLIIKNNYVIKTTNPIYAVSEKNSSQYIIVAFQDFTTNEITYFIEANDNNAINKLFLQNLVKQGIKYEKYSDKILEGYYQNIVKETLGKKYLDYNFDPPATSNEKSKSTTTSAKSSSNSLKGFVGKIGNGSILNIYLQNAIDTSTAEKGDEVTAILKDDWLINGHLIAPQGSVVYGKVKTAAPAKSLMRDAKLALDFNQLETPDGKIYNLETEEITFDVSADESKIKQATKNVVAPMVAGTLVALLGTLMFGGDARSYGKSALIGAGTGAGIAVISNVVQRGENAEIPSYTELELKVLKDVDVIINY